MASDALDFIHFVKSSNMAIHTEGSKAATYMLIGKGTRGFDIKDSTIVLHSNYGDIEISEATTVKQLGINWYVSGKLRKPLIDITCIVSKLKHAATALRGIAPMVKASSALSIVKTYVLSVISTAIVVWFPIVKHNDIGTLNKLRYWYCSVMTYICTDAKDVLGWCNSSKTVREGSSVEINLRHLTGLPTLDELYLASCKSHYPQVCKLVDMGLLTGVAVRSSRDRDKLVYLCHGSLQSKAISPLQDLIVTVASQGSTKIKFKSHRSWLMKLESNLC